MSGDANSRLRVAMVTPHYPPSIGGVEQHVAEVAARIASSGAAAVTVLTTGLELGLPAVETDGALTVRRFRAHPRGRELLFTPGIARALAREQWDIVHVQSYHTLVAPLAMAVAAFRSIPYVVTFHGGGHSSALRNRFRIAQRKLLGPLLRRADSRVAVARFEIDEYGAELALPDSAFVLIPNGVQFTGPVEPIEPDHSNAGPLIASIGRLERYKGHHHVIAALPTVLTEEPGAHLWIAGTGPEEAALRKQADSLGVGDRVEISAVPAAERTRMAQRMAAADLVVLLSEFETHPVAALEALSLKRPLLVGRGSGLGELADRGIARSVDPSAPPSLIGAAMLRELHDPLVPALIDLPTWNDCADQLLDLYGRVVSS